MKEIQSSINIIGGGLIGAATAYSLSLLGNKVIVLEKKAKFDDKKILDKRTTAISEGTKRFLENINIWKEISNYAEPIKKIKPNPNKTIPTKNLTIKFLIEPYLNI